MSLKNKFQQAPLNDFLISCVEAVGSKPRTSYIVPVSAQMVEFIKYNSVTTMIDRCRLELRGTAISFFDFTNFIKENSFILMKMEIGVYNLPNDLYFK